MNLFLLKSRSFTLVELSVVLLISSLLIATGLKVMSIRESSEIHAVVSSIHQNQKIIKEFENIYSFPPGNFIQIDLLTSNIDSSTINKNLIAGTGDGKINTKIVNYSSSNIYYSESIQAWKHLWAAKFINIYFSGTCISQVSCIKPGENIPLVAGLKDNNIGVIPSFMESDLQNYIKIEANKKNVRNLLIIASYQSQSINITRGLNASFSPDILEKIDTKFDDGNPTTGTIMASEINSNTNKCLNSTTSKYIDSNNKNCIMYFLI